MEIFGQVLQLVLQLFKTEFTIYGFTFSFWEIFCFTIIAGIVCWIIAEIFLGE